jgi:hypothetical protein
LVEPLAVGLFPFALVVVWGYAEFFLLWHLRRAAFPAEGRAGLPGPAENGRLSFLAGALILAALAPWVFLRAVGTLLRKLVERAGVSRFWCRAVEESVYIAGRSLGLGVFAVWLWVVLC